jgi:Flp pilus assembly pilin Flp
MLRRLGRCIRHSGFGADDRGATSIEYGLIAGALSIGIIWGLSSLSDRFDDSMTDVSGALEKRVAGSGSNGHKGADPSIFKSTNVFVKR